MTIKFVRAVDIGGTRSRIGMVKIAKGKSPEVVSLKRIINPTRSIGPKSSPRDITDLNPTLQSIAGIMQEQIVNLPAEQVSTIIGISAPGAWMEEGLPYPGSTPNIPGLEECKLAEELPSLVGDNLSGVVNNDGVANVLTWVDHLLREINHFPLAAPALQDNPSITGFIPGTGFGAGAFTIEDGKAIPINGPQQFFDIILESDPQIVTPESSITGAGFEAKFTGLSGIQIAALTEDRTTSTDREIARGIYRDAGTALGQTMVLTYQGGVEGESRKEVVNNPPELETQFWNQVRGTRIFILGGWLLSRAAKNHTLPALTQFLKSGDYPFEVIMANQIPGINIILDKDLSGIIGAALLI